MIVDERSFLPLFSVESIGALISNDLFLFLLFQSFLCSLIIFGKNRNEPRKNGNIWKVSVVQVLLFTEFLFEILKMYLT